MFDDSSLKISNRQIQYMVARAMFNFPAIADYRVPDDILNRPLSRMEMLQMDVMYFIPNVVQQTQENAYCGCGNPNDIDVDKIVHATIWHHAHNYSTIADNETWAAIDTPFHCAPLATFTDAYLREKTWRHRKISSKWIERGVALLREHFAEKVVNTTSSLQRLLATDSLRKMPWDTDDFDDEWLRAMDECIKLMGI